MPLQSHEGKEGEWEEAMWIYQGQIVPDQPNYLLW